MDKPIPVREIPANASSVDLTTGKETPLASSFKVLPPKKDHCQICAVKHDPAEPHNAQSLYYQTLFQSMIGRPATWADAAAHCSPEVQFKWKHHLGQLGHWSEPPNGEPPVKHHGVE